MTANENRPAWADGLDLSPERRRASDWTLGQVIGFRRTGDPIERLILRRLADAETRVAQLEGQVKVTERGEPDYLIDCYGDVWERKGEDFYHWGRVRLSRKGIEAGWGPVVAVWK